MALKDSDMNIDKNSYEPAYQQLANLFKKQIASGQYRPGSKLPAEAEICQKYDLSPMTVRRAIGILLDRGVVTTTRGRGTFVKGVEISGSSFSLDALTDLINGGRETRVKMLETSIAVADAASAARLEIEPGEYVILVKRLILQNEDPVLFHSEHLIYDPRRPLVEGELDATSLKGFFTGCGETDIKNGELTVRAALLKSRWAEVLDRSVNGPCFRFEHTFYDFEDRPLSSGWFICPADKLHFTAHIGHFED
ncbi:MAG: GntR family transcriptional regulator [Desulfarculaceae bacterium]|nr:GntR family transcriptional regulator [Desulfarculaceae bacterium]